MVRVIPPWRCPTALCADGGGRRIKRRIGKPLETVGRKARGWDAGYNINKNIRVTLVRLHLGKPGETLGPQSQRLRGDGPYARSATGFFASDSKQMLAKKGR